MKRILFGLAAVAATALSGPALAQIGDQAVDSAIAAGQVGEQADGYLGAVNGGALSADVRSRVDQINIRRRAAYTERATARNVSVDEMARATGCTLLVKNTPAGAYYRNEGGAWQRNASGVSLPSYCPK